jgi:hypothetical protein
MTVSYHQPLLGVDTSGVPSARWLADNLADRTGLPLKNFTCNGGCHGTLTGWHNDVTPGSAVTVELGPGPTSSELDRHAAAVLAVAEDIDPVGAGAIVALGRHSPADMPQAGPVARMATRGTQFFGRPSRGCRTTRNPARRNIGSVPKYTLPSLVRSPPARG